MTSFKTAERVATSCNVMITLTPVPEYKTGWVLVIFASLPPSVRQPRMDQLEVFYS